METLQPIKQEVWMVYKPIIIKRNLCNIYKKIIAFLHEDF